MIKWWDAHAHWADKRLDFKREEWLKQAQSLGLEFSLLGGVCPEDWKNQLQISAQFPNSFGLCFGLHPEWVATQELTEVDAAMNELSKVAQQSLILGEMGLDLRPQYDEKLDQQMEFFEAQVELACVLQKPVVLHLVRAFDEAMKAFHFFPQLPKGALVHSFNGSWPQAQKYLDLGFLISVGGPVLKADNHKLFEVIRHIPETDLVIETDLPDQAWGPYRGDLNPPESALAVASRVAELRKCSLEQVLLFSTQNLKRWVYGKSAANPINFNS
ncbi:MAG: TatD family hydrolase [Bdellovibrionales bacterium]